MVVEVVVEVLVVVVVEILFVVVFVFVVEVGVRYLPGRAGGWLIKQK